MTPKPTHPVAPPALAAVIVPALVLGAGLPAASAHATPPAPVVSAEPGGARAFLRVPPEKPTIEAGYATLNGEGRVNTVLTAFSDGWVPHDAGLSYTWLRDGQRITGAASSTYALRAEDSGHFVSVRITGSATGYQPASATSTDVLVLPGKLTSKPTPRISGTLRVGETVSVEHASWEPSPVAMSYQWLLDGAPIVGATGTSYVLREGDGGHVLGVSANGTKPGYLSHNSTFIGGQVASLLSFDASPAPIIEGKAVIGETLHANIGSWSPSPGFIAFQWYRGGGEIAGANGSAYTLQEADLGKQITVQIVASKPGYREAIRAGAPVGPVTAPPDTTQSPFIDVPTTHKFFREIAWMYTSGRSTGTRTPAGLEYRPSAGMNRDAMAAFMYRSARPERYTPPAESPFIDVPTTHKFYREIAWMHASGLSTGTKTPRGFEYKPADGMLRDAMAAFMYRAR